MTAAGEAATGKHSGEQNEKKPRHKEEPEALGGALLLRLGLLLSLHLAQEAAVDGAERGLGCAGRRERYVATAARAGDLNKRLLLKLRRHSLALVLLHACARCVGNRACLLGVAEANGEDGYAALCSGSGGFERAAAEVAAVGDEDDCVVVVCSGV